MARPPRYFVPGVPAHIIQRGNNRQVCFFTKRDYVVYLNKLHESSTNCEVKIHAFVLMTNHVHLLCTPKHSTSISRMMQGLGRYYVRYINSIYARTGTLWEGRYKSSLVCTENYLMTVNRYIELNPVRANIVSHPAEYPWSSYQGNALGKPIQLLSPHLSYLALGPNHEQRRRHYQQLFNKDIPDSTLEQIRAAANKAWVLGDNKFKRQIEQQLGRQIPPLKKGGDRKSGRFLTRKTSN